jgi:epsilon-lactone hydrolase
VKVNVVGVLGAMPEFGGLSLGIPVEPVAVPGGMMVTAEEAEAGAEPIVYVHGGGFEHRNPLFMHAEAYRFSRVTGRPVLAVYYRLAPEHRYPAPLDDVVAVLRAHPGVPVIGESSGGALVLSAMLLLRDAGEALPSRVLTWSAVTDLAITGESVDDSPADPVDRATLTRLIGQYLGDAPADEAPQSPLYGDLSGLPPLTMVVGGGEALRDDTLRFAEKAGSAEVDLYEKMPHTFQTAIFEPGNAMGEHLLTRVKAWAKQKAQAA